MGLRIACGIVGGVVGLAAVLIVSVLENRFFQAGRAGCEAPERTER